ncbi:chlorophyll synthesis pathway protein BchC [Skermanella aerolata]|uniref:Chlorophyll synthesis pathway protein BchC n=1 Tax=Skermanella aerolata TaxID=393310 RepID=A0A512DSE1_9PROT|nr:chlorophyll synthesis pathway protein BchC [Skermanella aerolata]KJB96132.1 2-desacetyl-2-hydroxyethyl bacteriochlorophyllide A dehydrogenase [Skermanella aerolata KACC 11604]GEO39401.1 chlorophyll synthesis pathway protein BchC [Skermanella aerolata]
MDTLAVVFEEPERLSLRRLDLTPPEAADVTVDILWSGISTGTERLLWLGRMPAFPGMGYPLVPGYESVGRITSAGKDSGRREGELVFVPGARCFGDVRGLFGGAASRLVVAGDRVVPVDENLGEQAVLLALAATAYHTMAGQAKPDLIVGHGVLGRLMARIALVNDDGPVTVWETNPVRSDAGSLYQVIHPDADTRHDYGAIYDVSGDSGLLNALIKRIRRGGEVVLAGFYSAPLSFDFSPAFIREARIRVAAEWTQSDLAAVKKLVETGKLSLDGLITHRTEAMDAADAYRTAFGDPACLKMILDWRRCS